MSGSSTPLSKLEAMLSNVDSQLAAYPTDEMLVQMRGEILSQIDALMKIEDEAAKTAASPEAQTAEKLLRLREKVAALDKEEAKAKELEKETLELAKTVMKRSFTVDLCLMVSLRPNMKSWIDYLSKPENITAIRTAVTGVEKRAITRWALFAYPPNLEDGFIVVPFTNEVSQWKGGLQALSREFPKLRPAKTPADDLAHIFTEILKLDWSGLTKVIVHITGDGDINAERPEFKQAALELASRSINYHLGAINQNMKPLADAVHEQYLLASKDIETEVLEDKEHIVYYVEDAIRLRVGQCRSFAIPMEPK